MRKALFALICIGVLISSYTIFYRQKPVFAEASAVADFGPEPDEQERVRPIYDELKVEVLVNGTPLEEYVARGSRYVEAREGSEYELRIHNPLGVRVGVALSVDGLNTIDARRTTAWTASKWVIGPYQSITIGGWQMSSARARRFYFTSERDSYGAKLGETANLGVISAVFYRERQPRPVTVIPPPRRPLEDDARGSREKDAPDTKSGSTESRSSAAAGAAQPAPAPSDDYAATGIGRSVHNDVRWVNMELDPRPAGQFSVRYEYHDALVRLGILPRPYPPPDTLNRRERATGFTDGRYCPEP